MPTSPCADAPTIAVPPTAAWMPPEPPPPEHIVPPGPVPAVHQASRDQFGRFIKGNSGGPVNPNCRRSAALRKALCDAVTAEDMYRLGKVMLEKALAGDVQAAKFLASYVIGRPAPAVDPDRLDLEELRQYQEEKAATASLNSDMDSIAPGFACYLISQVRPCRTLSLASTLGQALDTGVVPGQDVGPRPEADQARQGPSPDQRPNGANGGQPASPSPAPAAGPAPASRPAPSRRRRPPIPGWPGVAELLDQEDQQSANGPNGGRPGAAHRPGHGDPPTQTGQSASRAPDGPAGDTSLPSQDDAGPQRI